MPIPPLARNPTEVGTYSTLGEMLGLLERVLHTHMMTTGSRRGFSIDVWGCFVRVTVTATDGTPHVYRFTTSGGRRGGFGDLLHPRPLYGAPFTNGQHMEILAALREYFGDDAAAIAAASGVDVADVEAFFHASWDLSWRWFCMAERDRD